MWGRQSFTRDCDDCHMSDMEVGEASGEGSKKLIILWRIPLPMPGGDDDSGMREGRQAGACGARLWSMQQPQQTLHELMTA